MVLEKVLVWEKSDFRMRARCRVTQLCAPCQVPYVLRHNRRHATPALTGSIGAPLDRLEYRNPMHRQHLRSWLTWIALWVFTLAAFAPTVSRVLAVHATGWVEVCTAGGEHWVQSADDAVPQLPSGRPDAAQLDQCPLCVLMADRLAPAPPAFAFIAPFLPVLLPPLLCVPSVLARFFLLAAAPRGPPLFLARPLA